MKKTFSSAALILSLMLAACDKAPVTGTGKPNSPNNQNQSLGNIKSYRFKSAADQCDTYNRVFQSQVELCYAIQIDELNNDCAESERLAFFQKNCDELVELDSNKARQRILNVDGNSVDCDFTESGLPTIRHYTGTQKMIMEHTSTRAEVVHQVKDGEVALALRFIDITTNREIKRALKVWQDESEPFTLSSPTSVGSPVLTCLVSLAQNPDRE